MKRLLLSLVFFCSVLGVGFCNYGNSWSQAYSNYMRYYRRSTGRRSQYGRAGFNVLNAVRSMPMGVYDNFMCQVLGKVGKRSVREQRIVRGDNLGVPEVMLTGSFLRQYAVASFGKAKVDELERTLKTFFNKELQPYLKMMIDWRMKGYSFEAIQNHLFRLLLADYKELDTSASVDYAVKAINNVRRAGRGRFRQYTDAFDKSNCYALSYQGRIHMCNELQFAISITKFCGVSNAVSMLYENCGCQYPGGQFPQPPPSYPSSAPYPYPQPSQLPYPTGQPYPYPYTNAPGGAGATQGTVASFPDGCGLSSLNPARDFHLIRDIFRQWRIVGGVTAQDGEFPWVVVVNAGGGLCAGSIINATHILTAAHCTTGFSAGEVTVDVSEHDRFNDNDHVTFQASAVINHPGYRPGTEVNDIAIIQLANPIDFNSVQGAAPICLPTSDFSSTIRDGTDCVVAGWGTLEYQGEVPNVLQQVSVPTYSGSSCASNFNTVPSSPQTQVCAGVPGRGGLDSCQGDSGAPLFCSVSGRWVQYGIVSFGDGCANPGEAGVYTDVSQYLSWINSA